MASFIATIDPSSERRTRFIETAKQELQIFYGSPARVHEHKHFAVVSWSENWEPFRRVDTEDSIALVWGHAIERGTNVSCPADLRRVWRSLPERMAAPLDGIHAGLLYQGDGRWVAGSDLFGLMPVYYSSGKDHVLIGSTPELFKSHPEFIAELDAAGLAGILMSNGLVGGRALLRGVRRLDAGALLCGSRTGAPRELLQYRPQISEQFFGDTFDRNYRRIVETLDECFDRHINLQKRYGLTLSGGLDSRLVAGVMKRRDVQFKSITFGSTHDIEAQCASAVAKAIDVEHKILPIQMERYLEYAESECKWKHLSNGFSGITGHEPIQESAAFTGGMLSGYVKEAVIGCAAQTAAKETSESGEIPFQLIFEKLNRWGLPIATIKRLLARICDARVIDDVYEELEQSYLDFPGKPWQRAWLFGHYYRGRFHTAAVLGLHSRAPWPVVPYIDTKMLDLMGGMPLAHVEQRRMQYHMLKTDFPDLASVPLDRTSFKMRPLVRRHNRVVNRLIYTPREIFYRLTCAFRERRYYRRTYDFNCSGWNRVRSAAETHRKKALQILDEAALAEILAAPGEKRQADAGSEVSSKAKLMVGFLLWAGTYL